MNSRKPNHPGLILKHHYLEPLQLTVAQVARELSISRKTLSKIVNGHAAITPHLALKLSKAFSTSPEFWLNLQQTYSLWEIAHRSSGWRKIHAFTEGITEALSMAL